MEFYVIIVLYNTSLKDSLTLNSISIIFQKNAALKRKFKFLIYDNGPLNQEGAFSLPFDHEYICNEKNPGVAVAYNVGLKRAIENKSDWILLFDQDTNLLNSFFLRLIESSNIVYKNDDIVAIVPRMEFKRKLFSPSKVMVGGIHRPIKNDFYGVYKGNIFAVASATCIKTSFVRDIGGFNEIFWLDCQDKWLFDQIYKVNKKVIVIKSTLSHNLSILNYESMLNPSRYKNIIEAETIFVYLYKSRFDGFVYLLRLIVRAFKLFIFEKNKKYSLITFKHIFIKFSRILY